MTEPLSLPTPNLPLLRKVLDLVAAEPETWDQGDWARRYASTPEDQARRQNQEAVAGRPLCDTTFCIAGHAVNLTEGIKWLARGIGVPASGLSFDTAATRALGLTQDEAVALFYEAPTLDDVRAVAERIAARAGERL